MGRSNLMLCAWICMMVGCQSGSTVVDKGTSSGDYPSWDSGRSVLDSSSDTQTDSGSGTTDSGAPSDSWETLRDEWKDCEGSFFLDTDAFEWRVAEPACEVRGSARLESERLTLEIEEDSGCGETPWWLGESGPVVHGFERVEDRLILIPTEPLESSSAEQMSTKQFAAGDVDRQRWELLSSDGDLSYLDICFLPEGPFYAGRYQAIESESCGFLSCGGVATGVVHSEDLTTVYTACSGDCPCVGLLTSDDADSDQMSGEWSGANCARTMSGEFTGVRSEFPELDR